MQRLIDNLPEAGCVRVLSVTEKQFASRKILVGMPLFKCQHGAGAAVLKRPFLKKENPQSPGAMRVSSQSIVGFRGERGSYNCFPLAGDEAARNRKTVRFALPRFAKEPHPQICHPEPSFIG